MREAPSRVLMEALWGAGARVRAYDPGAQEETRGNYGERRDLVLCERARAALEGADALSIVTEWQECRSPDFELMLEKQKDKVVVDGRNLSDPEQLVAKGLKYYAIGRGAVQT